MPQISVIMPVYNVEKYLRECLDSVRAQTFTDWECICVDDGSTDSSLAILDEYAAKDSRFRVFHWKNKGSGPTRNMALDKASGEYVCFMDPDDKYPTDEVFKILLLGMRTSGCMIVGGGVRFMNEDGSLIKESRFNRCGIIQYRETQQQYWYQRYMFSRALIEKGHHRFPALRRRQDPPFFIRLMFAAGAYYSVQDLTYAYRFRNNQNGFDWMSDGGVKLKDHIRGLEDVMRFSLAHELDRLFIDNIYCMTHSNAFYKSTEVALVRNDLRLYIRALQKVGHGVCHHLANVASSSFLKEERRRYIRLWYIATTFGFHVIIILLWRKTKYCFGTLLGLKR